MSPVIDERVVQMEFDNKRFESNVSTSISTLDKLKAALKLDGAAKSFNDLERQAGRMDFSGITSAVEKISDRFSLLEIIGITALQNLVNKAVDAGERMVKALTLDQVMQGWDKYAEKTTSVQTIMAATAETWEKDATAAMRAQAMVEHGVIDPNRAYEYAAAYYDVSKGLKTAEQAAKELYITTDEFNQLGGINAAFNGDDIAYAGSQMDYVNDQMEKLNWFTDETSYNFVDMTSNIGKFTSNNVPLSQAATAMQGIANLAALSGQNAATASRAMYNFAQSIGVGSVKLQDWRSIENANMATSQFKQNVLDSAVAMGTLTKAADGTYKTLKGTTVTVESFSQTLSEGWFSKDVLMDSLNKYGAFTDQLYRVSEASELTASDLLSLVEAQKENTLTQGMLDKASKKGSMSADELRKRVEELASAENDLGYKAFKAAQEAKTFQDAIDATKDAASTKWMNIFENIFGDYEKARHVWTDFANFLYDTLVSPLEKLEEISEYFSELNGLDRIREAFSNIFSFLNGSEGEDNKVVGILSSIREGFEEVIPPVEITSDMIDQVLTNFSNFAESLKLTDEQAERLTAAGKGLANILTFIKNSVKNLWDATEPLRKSLGNLAKAVANAVVTLFGMASDMDTAGLKGDKLRAVCEFLAKVIDKVSDAIRNLNIDRIKSTFSGLSGILDGIGNAFRKVIDTISNFDFSGSMGKAIDWIKTKFQMLKDFLSNVDWKSVFKGMAGTGIVALIGGKVWKTLNTIGGPFKMLDGLKEKVGGILDGIGKAIGTFEKSIKVDALKKISTSILLLAGALLILGLVNYDKAIVGVGVLAGVLAGLVVAMKAMKGISKADMATLAASMLMAAAAMLVLAVSLAALAGAIALFTLVSRMNDIGEGLVLMAATLAIAVAALYVMSKMSPKVLIAAAALLVLSVSLAVLAGAMALFAVVAGMKNVWTGLAVMAAGLLVITAALVVLSQVAVGALVGAAALLVVSAALLVLAGAVAAFTAIAGMETFGAGLAGLSLMILILVAALVALGATGPLVLVGAAALLVAATACIVLAAAVAAAGLALPLLGAGLAALGEGIGSAVASIGEGVSSFLTDLSGAIQAGGEALGSLVSSIGTGMGEAIAALGQGIATAISDIIASVGEGIGRGITSISDAIGTFGDNLTKASLGIESLGNGVRSLEGISWAATALGIGELALALKKLKVDDLATNMSAASSAVISACTSMVSAITEAVPQIMTAAQQLGTAFVSGLNAMTPAAQTASLQIAGAATTAISAYSGNWTVLGTNVGIGFANGIYSMIGSVSAAASAMASAATRSIQITIDSHSPSKVTSKFGSFFGQGFANGIRSEVSNVESASESLAEGSISVIEQAKNLIAAILSDDFTPVISPVVDLSNVTSAANMINGSFANGTVGVSGELTNGVSSRLASRMDTEAQTVNNHTGDTINNTFNIYAAEGMDENALADAVMSKMQTRMVRRNVAFGA